MLYLIKPLQNLEQLRAVLSLQHLDSGERKDISIDHTMSGVLRTPYSRRVSETIQENTYNTEITLENVDVASISRNQTQFLPRNQELQSVGIFSYQGTKSCSL